MSSLNKAAQTPASVPDDIIKHRCAKCGATGSKKCLVCGTHYCSRTCQQAHWPEHEAKCKPVVQLQEYREISKLSPAQTQEVFNVPLIRGKACMFLPKPQGKLPPCFRDVDDVSVRKALRISDQQYANVKGMAVIRAFEYFEAMQQLTPQQRAEVVLIAKLTALTKMPVGTWERYFGGAASSSSSVPVSPMPSLQAGGLSHSRHARDDDEASRRRARGETLADSNPKASKPKRKAKKHSRSAKFKTNAKGTAISAEDVVTTLYRRAAEANKTIS